jgi:hypothetical protein
MLKIQPTMPKSAEACSQLLRGSESQRAIGLKAERTWSGGRANPDLAKQAGRACALGPNCLTTCIAALALQAGLPQAETRSCLTPTLPIEELTVPEFRAEPRLQARAKAGRAGASGRLIHTCTPKHQMQLLPCAAIRAGLPLVHLA